MGFNWPSPVSQMFLLRKNMPPLESQKKSQQYLELCSHLSAWTLRFLIRCSQEQMIWAAVFYSSMTTNDLFGVIFYFPIEFYKKHLKQQSYKLNLQLQVWFEKIKNLQLPFLFFYSIMETSFHRNISVFVRFTHAHLRKVPKGALNTIHNSAQHIRHAAWTYGWRCHTWAFGNTVGDDRESHWKNHKPSQPSLESLKPKLSQLTGSFAFKKLYSYIVHSMLNFNKIIHYN